jgi:hypothetical protein
VPLDRFFAFARMGNVGLAVETEDVEGLWGLAASVSPNVLGFMGRFGRVSEPYRSYPQLRTNEEQNLLLLSRLDLALPPCPSGRPFRRCNRDVLLSAAIS